MGKIIETLLSVLWNCFARKPQATLPSAALLLGSRVVDEQVTAKRVLLPHGKRPEHVWIRGKTGMGKSSLLKLLLSQDIRDGRGFALIVIHGGDLERHAFACMAAQERRLGQDLSERLIVIAPADAEYAVGLKIVGSARGHLGGFVEAAEVAEILKARFELATYGARTEELLRNTCLLLAENGLTLVDAAQLLTSEPFMLSCLARCTNEDVAQYFRLRYLQASEAMRASLREPILSRLSAFTADWHFRHILGQRQSTISLREAIDTGKWVVLVLDKGTLGPHAATLGALFLSKLRASLFARQNRFLFTIYGDEIQNLLAYDSALETLLSESRKYGCSVVAAHQFTEQLPPAMRAAALSVGTQVCFQLAAADGDKMAQAFDGGKMLAVRLKNLEPRRAFVKIGHDRAAEIAIPAVETPHLDFSGLYLRSQQRWARRRTEVEADIRRRHQTAIPDARTTGGLDGWE